MNLKRSNAAGAFLFGDLIKKIVENPFKELESSSGGVSTFTMNVNNLLNV